MDLQQKPPFQTSSDRLLTRDDALVPQNGAKAQGLQWLSVPNLWQKNQRGDERMWNYNVSTCALPICEIKDQELYHILQSETPHEPFGIHSESHMRGAISPRLSECLPQPDRVSALVALIKDMLASKDVVCNI